MNRKNEHLDMSLEQYYKNYEKDNFKNMKINFYNIPLINEDDVSLDTEILGCKIEVPFFINAMTGGSKKAFEINNRLSYIAKKTNILMFTGSYSPALKGEEKESFEIVKKNLLEYGSNIGIDKGLVGIQKTYNEFKPKFLQVHINTMQEYLMTEGDKNFSTWYETLKNIHTLKIPVIIKEVGFGINQDMIELLIENNIKAVDISGSLGTNFYEIENKRSGNIKKYMENLGETTLNSLLNIQKYIDKIDIIASGGIKTPVDILKCLILGAKAVGLSGHFLYLLSKYTDDEIVEIIEDYKKDLKFLMTLLGVKTIKELRRVKYIINE